MRRAPCGRAVSRWSARPARPPAARAGVPRRAPFRRSAASAGPACPRQGPRAECPAAPLPRRATRGRAGGRGPARWPAHASRPPRPGAPATPGSPRRRARPGRSPRLRAPSAGVRASARPADTDPRRPCACWRAAPAGACHAAAAGGRRCTRRNRSPATSAMLATRWRAHRRSPPCCAAPAPATVPPAVRPPRARSARRPDRRPAGRARRPAASPGRAASTCRCRRVRAAGQRGSAQRRGPSRRACETRARAQRRPGRPARPVPARCRLGQARWRSLTASAQPARRRPSAGNRGAAPCAATRAPPARGRCGCRRRPARASRR